MTAPAPSLYQTSAVRVPSPVSSDQLAVAVSALNEVQVVVLLRQYWVGAPLGRRATVTVRLLLKAAPLLMLSWAPLSPAATGER